MKEETNYPHIGQYYWQYFQQQDGKRNVGVSSTVPRVEMMLESGMVKEFVDKKREQSYSVVFDSKYVFEYFYQKIVLNMGWENNGKIDINVLRCFLDDFLLHCEAKCSNREQQAIEAQALALSQQFSHKTFEQWKQELLGDAKQEWVGDIDNEIDTQKGQMQEQNDKDVNSVSAALCPEEQREITSVTAIAEEPRQGDVEDNNEIVLFRDGSRVLCLAGDDDTDECEIIPDNDDKAIITMDDYDPDIEEDCGDWEPEISSKSIRELKRIASDAKIKGYGSMSKEELIAVIEANGNK